MKKSIFLFFAAILCATSALAGPSFSGGCVYFHNKGGWNDTYKYICISHDTWTEPRAVTVITNTQLWYNALPSSGWGDAKYMSAMGHSSSKSASNFKVSSCNHYTANASLGNWGFNSGNAQMLTPASGSNNAELTLTYVGNSYTSMNRTITVKAKVSTDGGDTYSEATSPGTLSASSYAFTSYTSCNSAKSLSSGKITCGYTANTTLTAADADGYTFDGWYNASGTKQTAEKTLSINPTADATYYAYYTRKALAEETHDVTISYMCGSTSIKENKTETGVGVSTPSEISAPSIDGYKFDSWSFGTGVQSTDAETANPIDITTKTSGIYTLTANYSELPKETVYFINTPQWTSVKAYAYSPENHTWPGVDATLEAEKIGDFDVYSYTATEGKYANVIFNGDGGQTADLTWSDGVDKYYIHNYNSNTGWYTKAEAEELLVVPVVYETVYFVNNKNWTKVQIHAWKGSANNGWPGQALTATGEKVEGFDVYSFEAAQGTYTNLIFNNKVGDAGDQSSNYVWTADKYYYIGAAENYAGGTKEEVATLVAPDPLATDVYLAGEMNSWNTTANEFKKATAEATTASVTISLTAKTYMFKIIAGDWLGNKGTMKRDDCAGWTFKKLDGGDETNCKIVADIAGDYTFTWDLTSKKLTVTYPELPTYNVTATVNPAETGSVEGAKEYKQGEQATLTAAPAVGYEFVNWTVAGEEVSTEATYSFTVTADVALVANFEKAATEVVLENAYKEVYFMFNRAIFFGEHATYGDISVQVNNYNGYGTYAEGVSSRIGDVRVNGSATFENKGETDLLTATLTDAEGTVYIVKAEVPTPKTYEVVATNATYINLEGWSGAELTVNGLTLGEEELTLTVYWDGVGGSEEGYEASAGFEGSIQGVILVDKGEDDVLSFEGTLKDASDNSYIFDFTATPKASETYTLTFEDMVIEPGQWDDNLHITAENAEYAIEFQLFGGKTKGYGEYGFTEDGYPDVDEIYLNEEYATMAEGTVANYYLNEETDLATIELTVILGIDIYNITLTGEPLVNPEDIVPTDTINITMTEGTIGLVSGMVKVAASSEEAELSILLVGEDPYKATTKDFSAYSSLVTTAGELTFLRGGLEIVEVGDVKIAYIGVLCSDHKWYNIVLTTGTEAPTALDNLNTTIAPVKMIENGQLIIINNGVQYNAQGAILK